MFKYSVCFFYCQYLYLCTKVFKMNRILSLFFVSFVFASVAAQDYSHHNVHILEYLKTPSINKGRVRIFQDPRLDSIMTNQKIEAQNNLEISDNVAYVVGRGYRIQIFSGNSQRESKNQAYEMEKELKEKMPNIDSYVTFTQPFWKLRVGNFRTYEEAQATLRNMKKEFPKWKEMFITNDIVRYPVRGY